jgi:hypothetical protein
MEEDERKSAREQPIREPDSGPPGFRRRVCGQLGKGAMFCIDCLAATMKPLGK